MVQRRKYFNYLLLIISGILLCLPFSYPSLYIFPGQPCFLFIFPERWKKRRKGYPFSIPGRHSLGITIMVSSSFWLYYPRLNIAAVFVGPIFTIAGFCFVRGHLWHLGPAFCICKRSPEPARSGWLFPDCCRILRFRLIPAFPLPLLAIARVIFFPCYNSPVLAVFFWWAL